MPWRGGKGGRPDAPSLASSSRVQVVEGVERGRGANPAVGARLVPECPLPFLASLRWRMDFPPR